MVEHLASLGAAKAAGLRYVSDARPGIRRRRAGKHFSYVDGRPVRDPQELQRIRPLAIPPAWTDVWICPSQQGHIQATGRDTSKLHRSSRRAFTRVRKMYQGDVRAVIRGPGVHRLPAEP